MKKISRFREANWQVISLCVGIGVGIAALLLYKLGSLTHGITANEYHQQLFSSSWHHIVHNPLFLPLTGLQWLIFTVIPHHGATVTRLASIFFGLITLGAYAFVLRRWYGVRTAAYGSVLFACSAWFLHVSRYGGPDILYLWLVPALLATQIAWERYSQHIAIRLGSVFVFAMLLYIPGSIWFILIAIGLQPYSLIKGWQQINSWIQRAVVIALFVILMLPLALASIQNPSLLQTWIGLPQNFDSALHIVKRLGLSVSYLFYRGPYVPELWLDRLPVLGIFGIVMSILGILFYIRHFTAPRTRQLIGLFFVGSIFFALQGPVSYSVLIPIVYFVVTAGIGYLLYEWLHVFPRNPLARDIGYSLLAITIVLACAYNLRAYFIAWPHSNATIRTFNRR